MLEMNWPKATEWPTLSAGEAHVWAVPLEQVDMPWLELEAVLSPSERETARRFLKEESRGSFVAARAALRAILAQYLEVPAAEISFSVGPYNKPRLADESAASGLSFNVSHSVDLALVAVTRGGEVGVDVERLRPVDDSQQIAARNFHPQELAILRAADAAQLPAIFLRCWTRKEAVLKAIGVGLGYPLGAFDVLSNRHADQPVELPAYATAPPTRCWLHDLDPAPGYVAAVATQPPMQPPLGFIYSL